MSVGKLSFLFAVCAVFGDFSRDKNMHNHQCKYCLNPFVCGEPADECFQKYIVCDTCFWRHDFLHFVSALVLGGIALAMTLFLISAIR